MNDKPLSQSEMAVLRILRATGAKGMNSFHWQGKFEHLGQIVRMLRVRGYTIKSRPAGSRHVDYVLLGEPDGRTVPHLTGHYEIEGNTARWVSDYEPAPATQPEAKQLEIL